VRTSKLLKKLVKDKKRGEAYDKREAFQSKVVDILGRYHVLVDRWTMAGCIWDEIVKPMLRKRKG